MELVTYRSEAADPAARGRELGLRFGGRIARTAQLYAEHYRTLGIPRDTVARVIRGCREALLDWDSEQLAELEAMAAAASEAAAEDLGPDGVMAVTARTEILATAERPGPGECSTVVVLPPGNAAPWTLQTWDWYAALVPSALDLEYTSGTGTGVRTFTEFGAPAKIGINTAGLGVHFNILHHASDHGEGGVPVHAIARRVLDRARTVAEAVEIARSARVSASSVLTVVTDQPDAVSIELSPQGVGLVRPSAGGATTGTRLLLHTNHFLDADLVPGDRAKAKQTAERYDHLREVSRDLRVPSSTAELAEELCGRTGDQAPICMRPVPGGAADEQGETLLTVALDVEHRTMDCFAGNPAEYARR